MNKFNAPPVSYPVEASPFLLRCLWGAGFSVCVALGLAWLPLPQGQVRWPGLVTAVGLLALLSLWRFWRGQARGVLQWDGQGWRLQEHKRAPSVEPGRLSVHLDAQRYLLLRYVAPGGHGLWLWVEAAAQPAHWHLLRCALYSGARSGSEGGRGRDERT